MKNLRKCFGDLTQARYAKRSAKVPLVITAIVAVIWLLAACPEPEDGGDPSSFGDTLELSGQVYLMNYDDAIENRSYQNFTGNLAIPSSNGGSGAITNGILNYSIEKPTNLQTVNAGTVGNFLSGWDNIQISKTNVRGFILSELSVASSNYYGLYRGNSTISMGNNSGSQTSESVAYIYVEEDVTISGAGKTETGTEGAITYTYTYGNLNLVLKAGWNAVYQKMAITATWTGQIENPTNANSTTTITMSLSNPSSLKWVLQD